ncbi:hypothetical protein [Solimonas soli]|uniref:hypothetical protein n=1 Tax=Solimonas soli TaxID=413479 RepID=UPI000480456E|nr:hypothetical protein [Solimonas soli]
MAMRFDTIRCWRRGTGAAALLLGALCGLAACDDDDGARLAPAEIGGSDAGLVDGPAATARFDNPANVEVGPDGTVYVADYNNNAVRAIATDGGVRTLVARDDFQRPFGLAYGNGVLYVETDGNDSGMRDITTGTVWRVDPASGAASVVARNIGRPRGLLVIDASRIAISDMAHHVIALLDPHSGAVTALAGSADMPGDVDGSGAAARFNRPYGMALADDGALLVADRDNNRIRKVTLAGVVTTFAGTGAEGHADGALASATLHNPQDVAAHGGIVYVADTQNFLVRRIADGAMTTIAGNGERGYAPGQGTDAAFAGLEGASLTADGRTLWIADGSGGEDDGFNRVRRIAVH